MTDHTQLIETLCASWRCGYDNNSMMFCGDDATRQSFWEMGRRQRQIDAATYTLEVFGRGRITDTTTSGCWIQIDHDRSRIAELQAAVSVLDAAGLIEHHPHKGNPRNVRIVGRTAW